MNSRKLRQPGPGRQKPAATRLKELSAADRSKVLELLRTGTYEQQRPKVEKLVGFACSVSLLSKYYSWAERQQDLEESNDLIAQFEEFTRKQNPTWSADQVRETAIKFFLAHTAAKGDLDGFVSIATLDQKERSGRTKARLAERKIEISERRIAILEKKAAQADRAKGLLKDRGLSEAERASRMRELFGIS